MIGRRRHPREAMRQVYVPLRRGVQRGQWVPLAGPGFRDNVFDAAKMCADDAAREVADIAHRARILRALCEHPELEFWCESVDADMLRDEARALEELLRHAAENLARLLELSDGELTSPPGEHNGEPVPDAIREGLVADGLLQPHEDADEPWQSADELFAQLLASSLRSVEQLTGEAVSRAGAADAIARLRALHDGDGDEADEPDEADDRAPDSDMRSAIGAGAEGSP